LGGQVRLYEVRAAGEAPVEDGMKDWANDKALERGWVYRGEHVE
jgi:hypothetical protein